MCRYSKLVRPSHDMLGRDRRFARALVRCPSPPFAPMKRFFPSSSDDESDAGALAQGGPKEARRPSGGTSSSSEAMAHDKFCERRDGASEPVPRLAELSDRAQESGSASAGMAPQSPLLDWTKFLLESSKGLREALGTQARPLMVHTLFSGMGSPEAALRCLGLDIEHQVAAEMKPCAHRFCEDNGLIPSGHYYTDVEPLASAGSAPCRLHNANCPLPVAKPDLLIAGFPCTPFTSQRGGHGQAEVRQHREFCKGEWTTRCIARIRPRMFLLENVPAFAGCRDEPLQADSRQTKGASFCSEMSAQLRQLGYAVEHTILDLRVWTEARSSRVFVFGVESGLGEGLVHRAIGLAERWQEARSRSPPVPWTEALSRTGSEEWLEEQALWGSSTVPPPSVLSGAQDVDGEACESLGEAAKWEQQAGRFRRQLAQRGRSYHDAQPWSKGCTGVGADAHQQVPSLAGLPRPVPARKWELFDLGVLWALDQLDISELTATNVRMAVQNLMCETTQNPARGPFSFDVKRLCRRSRPYSYSHDRMLYPSEMFALYGWDKPVLRRLTRGECGDLIGDSMALQSVGAALLALICSVGLAIPGLWAGSEVATSSREQGDDGATEPVVGTALRHRSSA